MKRYWHAVFVFAFAGLIGSSGCGGGGGGARTAVPQMTSQGRSVGASITSTLYVTGAARTSARVRDPFLSKIPADSDQSIDPPPAGAEPLKNAKVTANLDGTAFQTTTDSNGQWKATGVPEGTQEFVITKDNEKVIVPITVKKDTAHTTQVEISGDEDCGGQTPIIPSKAMRTNDADTVCTLEAESQTIHGDGSDGYKKEKHEDGSSDTVFENGNRDAHQADGTTDRDINDDGIVDQRFTDMDDDGVPDGAISLVGGDALDNNIIPASASIDNEPPDISTLTAKDSKGKSKNTAACTESLDMDLGFTDADGDSTAVKWTVYDVEGNDVTSLYLNSDDIVAPTFSPPQGECSKPGAYIISAEVTDSNGHISGKDVIVTTETPGNKSPIVSIKANHTVGDAPLTVDLECVAKDTDGSIVSYCWDFDKSNGIDINDCDDTDYSVTKTFISEGKYRATCIVTDDQGAVSFAKRVIIVRKAVTVKPEITLTPSATEITTADSVKIGVSVYDPDKVVEDIKVSATGGTFPDDKAKDGSITWKPPAEGGEFVIDVEVTYDDGKTETKRERIVVDTPDNKAPHSDADGQPAEGGAPLTVELHVDVEDEDGEIVSVEWDLNDEDGFQTDKTGDTVEVKYGEPGEYTATSKACDEDNSCSYDKIDIKVKDTNHPPALECFVTEETVGVSGKVTLSVDADDQDNDNLTYSWTANGGSIGSFDDPVTNWTLPGQAGAYTATVAVSDGVNPPVACQADVTVALSADEPEPPEECRATGDDGSVHVEWDPSPSDDITWYRVYRDAGSGFQPLAEVQAAEELAYEDTAVTNGVTYKYKVTAVNESDAESDPCDYVTATPDADIKEVIEVGEDPSDAEYNDETDEVVVPVEGEDTVVIIDPETGDIEDEIEVGDEPVDVCIDPETGDIFVVNDGDDTLTMIDGPTHAVVSTFPIDAGANACEVAGGDVYISDDEEDDVSVVDPETGGEIKEIEVGEDPVVCGSHEGSGQVYVTNKSSNTLSILDTVTMTQISEITVGIGPNGCAVNSTDNTVYVANENSNTVAIVNGNTKQAEKTIPVGKGPVCGCDVNEISNQIVITNKVDNTITIIDGVTRQAVETVNTGSGPGGACFDEENNEIYVSNEYSNTVTVITNPLPNTPTPGTGGDSPPPPAKCYATGKNGAVELSWEDSIGADAYTIYRSGGAGSGFAEIGEILASAMPEYTDATVTNNTEYKFKVTASSTGGGESMGCDYVEATPDPDVEDVVDVGENPSDAEYNDETDKVVVPVEGEDKVVIIDPETGDIEDEVTVGDGPVDVCIDPDNGDIYVVNDGDDTISVIDPVSLVVVFSFSVDSGANACEVAGGDLYVSDDEEDDVSVVDPETGAETGEIDVGADPVVCGSHEGSGQVYVTNKSSNTLSILDMVTMTQISEISVDLGPNGCAVNSTNNRIYIANEISNTVTIVNGNTRQAEKTIPVGKGPVCGCDVNERSNKIVITNKSDNTITIIDGVTQEAAETVNTGGGPGGACFDEENNEIYVSNEYSNTVTIISNPLPNTPTPAPVDGNAPPAPARCSATGMNGAVELTWENSLGADSYTIYRATGAGGAFSQLAEISALSLDYTDATVTNNTEYKFKVTATSDNAGEGAACDYAEATPDPDVEDVLKVGEDPADAVYDPVNKRIFIPVEGEDEVVVVDPDTGEIDSMIVVGDGPVDACSNPVTGEIYVVNSNDSTLSVINGATLSVTNTVSIDVGSNACAAGNGNIYISNKITNKLSILDDATLQETGEVGCGDEPQVCGVHEGTGQVYVTNRNDNSLSIIDGINQTQITEITVGSSPSGCALNSATNMVYVANENSNTVTIINGTTMKAAKTLPVGDNPVCGCDVNETSNKIVISNKSSNTVPIIDGATMEVVETVNTGEGPGGACFDDENNKIYITNEYSDTVSVIANPQPNTPTDVNPPAAPARCYSTGSNGTVDISWDASASGDIASYEIHRDDGMGGGFAMVALKTAGDNLEYEDTSVSNGTEYSYKVYPVDNAGNTGSACPEVEVMPDATVEDAAVVGDSPGSAVYCPGASSIFIVNENSNTVSVVDSVTMEQTSVITVGDGASGACAPDNCGSIYVTNKNANTISVINPATVSVSQTISVSGGPSSCVVNENTNDIYVGLEQNDSVAVIDDTTFLMETLIPVGDSPTVCGADNGSGKVYVTNSNDNTLSIIDGINQTQETVISVGSNPSGCAAAQGSNLVFVANKNSNTITVINATTGTVEKTIALPSGDVGPDCTSGCAVDESTNQVIITNETSNTLTLINGSQLTVEDSVITGGDSPSSALADEANHKIIITNRQSNSVTIIGNPLPNTEQDSVPPGAPAACYATGKSDGVRVSWEAVPAFDLDKYIVYRSATPGAGFTELEQIDGAGTFMQDTTAAADTTYYYYVTAVDNLSNEGPACDEVSGTADANVTAVIETGDSPCCIAGDTVNNYVYISNESDNSITVVNRDTYQYVRTIDMSPAAGGGGCCSDIEIDAVNNRIYVTNRNTNKLTIINGTTHVIEETITVPGNGGPGRCEYNEVTNEIIIVNDETSEVVIMNPDTWEYRKVYVEASGCPCDVQVNRSTNEVFVLNKETNKVTVINGNNYTVVETVLVDGGAGKTSGCVINDVTNTLYITNESTNEVYVMNTTEHVITQTITMPGTDPGPSCSNNGCAVDPGSNQIYISNINDNSVTIINGEDYSVMDTISVGEYPVSLCVEPDAGTLMVLNKNSNSVSVVTNPVPFTPTDTVPPAKITGLKAVSKDASIDLSWTAGAAPDINGCKIYRSEISGSGYIVTELMISSNSYSDTLAQDDLVYFYTVTAVDTSGNESPMADPVMGFIDSPDYVLVGDGPTDVAINETTNLVYIPNSDSGNVTVINAVTNTITDLVTVTLQPMAIAVSESTGVAVTANGTQNMVSVINTTAGNSVASYGAGVYPGGIAIDETGGYIFLPQLILNQVVRMSLGGGYTIGATANVGVFPGNVAVNETTRRVFSANLSGSNVSVINADTMGNVATVSVGNMPFDVGVNETTNQIYVLNYTDGSVSVINGATNLVTATISVGTEPTGVAVDESRNLVYVTNSSSGTISVIDGATNKVVGAIDVGDDPWAVGVHEGLNKLFIAVLTPNKVYIRSGFQSTNDSCYVGAPMGATPCCGAPSSYATCPSVLKYVCGSDGEFYRNGCDACGTAGVNYWKEASGDNGWEKTTCSW